MANSKLQEIEKLIKTKEGHSIKIPFGGSLGLLALGDIGLLAWRMKKQEIIKAQIERRKNAK